MSRTLLQLVLQVVAAVARHYVQEQQAAPDDACLAAGRGSRQGYHNIGGGHQLRHPVGEAERYYPRVRPGQFPQSAFHCPLTPCHGEHLYPGVGKRRHALHQRAESPAAVDHQDRRVRQRHAQGRPGLILNRGSVEGRTDGRWHH